MIELIFDIILIFSYLYFEQNKAFFIYGPKLTPDWNGKLGLLQKLMLISLGISTNKLKFEYPLRMSCKWKFTMF